MENSSERNKIIIDVAISLVDKYRLIEVWKYGIKTVNRDKIYCNLEEDIIEIFFNRLGTFRSFTVQSLVSLWLKNSCTSHEIENDVIYILGLYQSCYDIFNKEYDLSQLQNLLTFVKNLEHGLSIKDGMKETDSYELYEGDKFIASNTKLIPVLELKKRLQKSRPYANFEVRENSKDT